MTQALGRAVAVLYNATEDQRCLELELSGPAGGPALRTWLYQTCTELMAQEQPFFPARGAPADMFWDQGIAFSSLHLTAHLRRWADAAMPTSPYLCWSVWS